MNTICDPKNEMFFRYVQSQPNAIPLGLKFYKSLGNNGITKIFGRILPNIFVMPLFPHVL